MAYSFDENIVSDLHKDAYGVRPREGFWSQWTSSNDNEKQVIWDGLLGSLNNTMEREERELIEAKMRWEAHIAKLMKDLGINFETAVRWDMQAMGVSRDDPQAFGYYLWHWGISSLSYERKIEMKLGWRRAA